MAKYTSTKEWEFNLPHVDVSINSVDFRLGIPNKKSLFIAQRIEEKFGKLANWIDLNVDKDSTFVDVGSNFGIASIYAAMSKSCQVLSFEPHYGSYYIQYRNIIGNKLQDNIFLYQIALSSGDAIGNNFKITDACSGRALNTHILSHSDNPAPNKLSEEVQALKASRYSHINSSTTEKAAIMQTNMCMTFDHFYQLMNCRGFDKSLPMHMKIDVDGLDFLVLTGAINSLENIQTIFIEYLPKEVSLSALIPDLLGQFNFEIVDQDDENLVFKKNCH